MSTFADLDVKISILIANDSEIFYDEEMKRDACNATILQIAQDYDIPELTVKGTITFTTGSASKPTGYYRMVKLWSTSGGIELNEFVYVDPDQFDRFSATESYYWTEDHDGTSTRKLYVRPTSTTSLSIRYIKSPTEMTDSTTDSGLSTQWDEAVVYGAVTRLYHSANRYDEAREFERIFRQRVAEIYGVLKNPGGVKGGSRFRSVYEKRSQLGGNSSRLNSI